MNGVNLYAKIRILKQITTMANIMSQKNGCQSLCKDTNFKANHNTQYNVEHNLRGVNLYAKIRILKQITTAQIRFSNEFGCQSLCKDTNFKANHNQ